jgi:hypothetical protein
MDAIVIPGMVTAGIKYFRVLQGEGPMDKKWRTSIALLVLFSCTTIAHGASVFRVDFEIDKGSKFRAYSQIITVDDEKARVDYLGADNKKTEMTPFVLTLNGGKSWILGNEGEEKYFCGKVDMKDFFNDIGAIITRLDKLANATVTENKVVKLGEEPGPEMLGYSTTHVRFESTARIKASILLKKFEFRLKATDDVWYTTDVDVNPIKKRWLEALAQTGYEELDKLTSKRHAQILGPILKQVTEIETVDVKKNKVQTETRKGEVVSVQELKSSDIPEETFAKPDCKDLNKDQMREAEKNMFKEGRVTL